MNHSMTDSLVQRLFHANKLADLFEIIIQEIYSDILISGDIAVDGGANFGKHLFAIAHAVGSTGKVIAFEPIPELVEKL